MDITYIDEADLVIVEIDPELNPEAYINEADQLIFESQKEVWNPSTYIPLEPCPEYQSSKPQRPKYRASRSKQLRYRKRFR